MNLRGKSGGTIFQQNGFEVVAQGIHDRGQYTEIRGDPRYGAETDFSFFQPFFQPCAKKSGKSRLGKPVILLLSNERLNDFSATGSGQGVGMHSARKDKVVLMEGIRGENDRPSLLSKHGGKGIDRFDEPLCKGGNAAGAFLPQNYL